MIKLNFRHKEIKAGEKSDYQEYNQGVGEGEKEAVQDIPSVGDPFLFRFLKISGRV